MTRKERQKERKKERQKERKKERKKLKKINTQPQSLNFTHARGNIKKT